MTPERWQQMKEWFERARDARGAAREAVLASAGDVDPTLETEVRSLLNNSERFGTFLEPLSDSEILESPLSLKPGSTIASCTIVRIIGYGGMGFVFEAQQSLPRRRVAVKLFRSGHCADEADARIFQREVDALARLQHPWIAAIHEAGRTEDGQAYIIMEFVEGIPLDEYAHLHNLGDRERLVLIHQVAQAIAHAHGRGVIHRDIKPSNIMVRADGTPKVLDFGLARIVDPGAVSRLLSTNSGHIQGTVAYMSPEQFKGSRSELDVRSEVYALGVLLYQLVTGQFPHDISGVPLPQVARLVAETPPIKPSARRSGLDQEIETIILKCLSVDPARRYQTVDQLARDIGHHLAGEPIEAQRDNRWYLIRKGMLRHKLGLALALSFSTMVLGFLAFVTLQSGRLARQRDEAVRAHQVADRQRQRADRNLQKALETLDRSLVRFSAPYAGEGPDLEKARRSLREDTLLLYHDLLEDEPNAEMQMETATAYTHLGQIGRELRLNAEAEGAYQQAILLFSHLVTQNPADETCQSELAKTWNGLGTLLCDTGQMAKAETAFRHALESRQWLAQVHPGSATCRFELGRSLNSLGRLFEQTGRFDDAEMTLQQAVSQFNSLYADAPQDRQYLDPLVLAEMHLADVYTVTGCYAEAEYLYHESIRLIEPVTRGSSVPEKYLHRHARVLSGLGNLMMRTGRPAEAEAHLAEALIIASAVAAEHPAFPRYLDHVTEIQAAMLALDNQAGDATALVAYSRSSTMLSQAEPDAPAPISAQ